MSDITWFVVTPNCSAISWTETPLWRSRYVIMPSIRRSRSLARSAIGAHLPRVGVGTRDVPVQLGCRAQQGQHVLTQSRRSQDEHRRAVPDDLLRELPHRPV